MMHDDKDNPLVSVSPLNDEGSSFTASYLEQENSTTLANNFITKRGDVIRIYAKTEVSKKTEIIALKND
jgi:hypothetical protein